MILSPLAGRRDTRLKGCSGGDEIHFGCARPRCQLEIHVDMSSLTAEETVWSSEEKVRLEI